MDTKYSDYGEYEYTSDNPSSDDIHLFETVTDDSGNPPKKQVRKAIEYYFDRKRLRKDLSFFS